MMITKLDQFPSFLSFFTEDDLQPSNAHLNSIVNKALASLIALGGLLLDNNAKITKLLKEFQPGFEPEVQTAPFVIAIITTVLGLVLVWRVGRSMRRAVVNWATGITLIWILAMTLWLPWLDSGKSYRNMVESLKKAMPQQYQCIKRARLDDNQRAMLHYFRNIDTQTDQKNRCDLYLIQGNQLPKTLFDKKRWKRIWEGRRKDDQNEHFRLYRRVSDN